MSQDVLKNFFQLWDGYEAIAFIISLVGLFLSAVGLRQNKSPNPSENKSKFSLKKIFLWIVILTFGIVFVFASFSGLICMFYTEVPYLVGEDLVNARGKLHQNKLKFDENTEQLIGNLDALDYTNYIVETQEPTYGIILLKNSTVSVKFIAKDITESSNIEQNEKAPEQNSNEDKSTSTLPPSTPTTEPKSNTSTPRVPTSTSDLNNSNPFNDTSGDPIFNGNVDIGGGVNTSGNPSMDYTPDDDPVPSIGGGVNFDDGAGGYQPQEPPKNDYPEQDVVSGTVSAGF